MTATTLNSAVADELRRRRRAASRWIWTSLSLLICGLLIPVSLKRIDPKSVLSDVCLVGGVALPSAGVTCAAFLFVRRRQMSRAIDIALQGDSLGLTFSEAAEQRTLELVPVVKVDLNLSYAVRNVLEGEIGGYKVKVMDIATQASEYSFPSVSATAVEILDGGMGLPDFKLTPRRWISFERVGWFRRRRQVDLADQPEFAWRFRLEGHDHEAIHNVFTPEVVELCLAEPGREVEVLDGMLTLTSANGAVEPEEFGVWIAAAIRLAVTLNATVEG